jgi:DNA-binding transcriptional LysR family regulator
MQTPSPIWDDLRILLAVHRGKSFLAASKVLGVATSTVARRVEAFERALGRPLVLRGNGGTAIDADALSLVALAEQMELGLDALRRAPDAARITGTVRVSAPEGFVRPLAHILARVHMKHPALTLEVVAESRLADLVRREADIGVRITRTSSPTLIEKPMGRVSVAVFGARSYIEGRLPSAQLRRDMAGSHDWVGLDRTLERLPQEQWMRAYGATRFALRSTSAAAVEEAVIAGMGLGILAEVRGAALDLVRVETDTMPPAVDVFLAFHRDARKTPRVRVVVSEIEAGVRRALA